MRLEARILQHDLRFATSELGIFSIPLNVFSVTKLNTPETLIRLDDPDMSGAEAAMLRAAKAARDEARKAGLTIPVWENGAVGRKHPVELEEEAVEGV